MIKLATIIIDDFLHNGSWAVAEPHCNQGEPPSAENYIILYG